MVLNHEQDKYITVIFPDQFCPASNIQKVETGRPGVQSYIAETKITKEDRHR